MDTEKVLEVLHEMGILSCMLLFIWSGGSLMQGYSNDGDFLPLVAGLILMIIGAVVILRSPRRWRTKHADYYGADYEVTTEEWDGAGA